jgi:mRNA interferase RelE/StbE
VDTYFEASFEKYLKKLKDRTVLQTVKEIIADVKQAATIRDIASVKKLRGYDTYYRIRFGKYRIGLEITNDAVIFVRCLHRKDMYRYFPKE